jgi:hypothetical protein
VGLESRDQGSVERHSTSTGAGWMEAFKREIAKRGDKGPEALALDAGMERAKADLSHLPRMTPFDRPKADPRCPARGAHRWQTWPNGLQCTFCGQWRGD